MAPRFVRANGRTYFYSVSTDDDPLPSEDASVAEGSEWTILDTGQKFIRGATGWIEQERDALLIEAVVSLDTTMGAVLTELKRHTLGWSMRTGTDLNIERVD